MRDYLNLPFFILVAYSTLCFFRLPELSDALIIIAIASLYGYKLYLNSKLPIMHEPSEEEALLYDELRKLELQKKADSLRYDINRINSNFTSVEEARQRNKVVF